MSENGQHHNSDRQENTRLAPPSFSLPDDMKDDYEVWSVRLPVSVDVQALDGMKITMLENGTRGVLGTFCHGEHEYGLVGGHPVEHESFRLLLPEERPDRSGEDSELDDSDDNDDEAEESRVFMRPSPVTFGRHINVVDMACLRDKPETELAPRLETAPKPADPIRRSYSSIPQASGLKRRWMPAGVPTESEHTATPTHKRKRGTDSKDSGDQKLNGLKTPTDETTRKRSADLTSTTLEGVGSKQKKVESSGATPDTSLVVSDSPPSEDKSARKQAKKERKEKKRARKERKAEKKAKKEQKHQKKEKKKHKQKESEERGS